MSKNRNLVLGVLGLPLVVFTGCSRNEVQLGEPEGTEVVAPGGRCAESSVVPESVRVTSQAELDALAGCEQIQGDLRVWYFPDPDLSPLYALRTVTGLLEFSPRYPVPLLDENNEIVPGQERPNPGTSYRVWLESLNGLEALQSVGALTLFRTRVASLEALSNLRDIGGMLNLSNNKYLTNLHGLEGVQSLVSLSVDNLDALESLDGLGVPVELDYITLAALPALRNVDALQPLTSVRSSVVIYETGLEQLNGLRNLTQVRDLTINKNDQLQDASALGSLVVVDHLGFDRNPVLTTLPVLGNIVSLNLRGLSITNNGLLEEVSLDFPRAQQSYSFTGAYQHVLDAGPIDIGNNASLRSIRIPAGLVSSELLGIYENPSLTSVDLGSVEHLDELTIDGNPNLEQLSLGSAQTIDTLNITNNPKLSIPPLANLRTFEQNMIGNAD